MLVKRYALAIGATIAGLCLASTPILAQTRPVAHWSNFDKTASPCACHIFAREALLKQGLTIQEDSGSVLIGLNDTVIVEIVCKPGGTQAFVSAFSSDSATAEAARNDVRARIVRARLFDTC